MDPQPADDLTAVLERAAGGDEQAHSEFWSRSYEQLRAIAATALQCWNGKVSLVSTDVVNEAFLLLIDRSRVTERGHHYFLKCFATECRRLLVDRWRAKHAIARGGELRRVPMVSDMEPGTTRQFDLLELSDVVDGLAREDKRAAQIVDMRIFGGMTVVECAGALGIAIRTVELDWTFAKAWLQRKLGP